MSVSDAPEISVTRDQFTQRWNGNERGTVEQRYQAARMLSGDLAILTMVVNQTSASGSRLYLVNVWR